MENILSTILFVLIGLSSTGWLLMRSARAVQAEVADSQQQNSRR